MSTVYLDHNASAPIRPEAAEAVCAALKIGGNPSSVHARGRAARAALEEARATVAAFLGADPDRLVFTGGGTEANGLAIHGAVASGEVRRLIVGATEHDAVTRAAEASGLPVEVWPVAGSGVADLGWLRRRLAAWSAAEGRPFAALMLANNETGVIQPVAEAARLIHEAGGLLHIDAVQAAGRIAVDIAALGADTLATSAHKLGGPQGIGALAYAPEALTAAVIQGGGQEFGLRSGTENVAGAAGFAAAISCAEREFAAFANQARWRDAAAARLDREVGIEVAGAGAPRLSGTLCFAAADGSAPSAVTVMALDLEGVMVSAGAACASGRPKPSGVLAAMGLGHLAGRAIRASGGWNTTAQDWARFADAWLAVHARFMARAAAREFA